MLLTGNVREYKRLCYIAYKKCFHSFSGFLKDLRSEILPEGTGILELHRAQRSCETDHVVSSYDQENDTATFASKKYVCVYMSVCLYYRMRDTDYA